MARPGPLKVLGSGHCFNRIADTTGTLVSLAQLPVAIDLDREARQVRVSAHCQYVGTPPPP